MKHIILYTFICISTCVFAQSYTQPFISTDLYGVSGIANNPNVSIFPNPTSDFINIEDKDGVVATATIFNLIGKEIATFKVDDITRYDMMSLQKGIYLVQLKDDKDLTLQTVRIKKI